MLSGVNIFALAKRMQRPLILDGAVGSRLCALSKSKTARWAACANLSAPEAVISLHKRYIKAGADIITTNTFRTNPAAFARAGEAENVQEEVQLAAGLARAARDGKAVIIAGANPPAEDSYAAKRTLSGRMLLANHKKHILSLAAAGVDFILNESISFMDEIDLVCRICSTEELPFVVSIILNGKGLLASGEKPAKALAAALDAGAQAVSINCTPPEMIRHSLPAALARQVWGCYPNCGVPTAIYAPTGSAMETAVTPVFLKKWFFSIKALRPAFIGTCCGSGPEHTKALFEAVHEKV